MRYLISAAVLALALTACGGGSDDDAPRPDQSAPASSSAANSPETESAAEFTMLDVCPAVESALRDLESDEDWDALVAEVDELASTSDLESQNALELLRPGVEDRRAFVQDGEGDAIDTLQSLNGSIGSFADRCLAAGSSALQ